MKRTFASYIENGKAAVVNALFHQTLLRWEIVALWVGKSQYCSAERFAFICNANALNVSE